MSQKEIDDDAAAKLARDYFEKETVQKQIPKTSSSADRILADWRNITITSVKKGRKDFTVKCELYEEPTSSTKTKHTLKISMLGEIKKDSKEAD
jgi:hypothetical protein